MKKKKTFLLGLLLLITITFNLRAQTIVDTSGIFISPIHNSCIGKIISHEYPALSGNFVVKAVCYFLDTATIANIKWQLPESFNFNTIMFSPFVANPGDSLLLSITFSINDTLNLPFYPQDINLEIQLNKQDSIYQPVIMAGKLYITPYNSIEIWNLEDFYNLERRWMQKDSIEPPRMYIPRENIPQSNLGNDKSIYERDSATWNHWWIDDFREIV